MAPSKLAKQTLKAAPQDPAAAHRLAKWYERGEEGLSQDIELSAKWEWEAAKRGCADAQYTVGVVYARGSASLQIDQAKAITWFRKAARQGRALH